LVLDEPVTMPRWRVAHHIDKGGHRATSALLSFTDTGMAEAERGEEDDPS
jgi:hypothetical protein